MRTTLPTHSPVHRQGRTNDPDSWRELIDQSVPAYAPYLQWQHTQWCQQDRRLEWWQIPGAQLIRIPEHDAQSGTVFGAGSAQNVAQLLHTVQPQDHHFSMPVGTWEYPTINRTEFGAVASWDLLLARGINPGVTPPHFGGDIVEFTPAEYAEVAQFQAEVFPSSRLTVDRPDTRWFGLRFQGRIDCVIGASGWRTSECVHLGSFATRPAARGRGIGTAVMTHVAELAIAAQGAVSLGVYRENHAAIALYHRLGFHTIYQADSLHHISSR